MNIDENNKFLSLFEQSGEAVKAHFITSCIFNRPIKVVKIDKGVQDYYMRMTTFFGQYRAIGTNYNQIVKALKSNFTEKKALAFLYKLEKATLELVILQRQMMVLTDEFERKYGHLWLQK
ncbi:conjugal transfer protein MobA [Dysgonomonas capnocytophagoides]|nr:conjugal transfer protein MobA [Dysgonomonas capnocytophagoides]